MELPELPSQHRSDTYLLRRLMSLITEGRNTESLLAVNSLILQL